MRILVTGASGFIGARFARHALEQGLQVRVSGRRPEAVGHLLKRGAQYLPGDLSDPEFARRLCQSVDAVVHCAGPASHWGRAADFQRDHVQATENIVEACLKEQVARLVHLSSAAIYFDGRGCLDIREPALPRRFHDTFAATRHLAEQKVFGAAEFGLQTIALRPARVIGAGDTYFLPRLLERQRNGRLSIVGNGLNKVDFTSVQNLNQALFSALTVGEGALGRAYNLSNGTPLPFWDVINYALRQLQQPQVRRYRSRRLAYLAGAANEALCLLWPGRPEPTASRLDAQVSSHDFTLDISRARQLLNYQPGVSLWTALDEFCGWWQAQR
ncbi:NAD-dependent epimerase/dehydratase family protein [Pseudomonas sp. nanlin1]|uniref:NAD-dependent epimerase/dehydratase family protein n=1 Tax=Pseudomonas sp. nanlin1 TaxID=3040605 RepID=UPI003890900B